MAQEHSHDHPHDHDHDHPVLKYSDDSEHDYDETARYPLMAEAMRQLLIEKGVVDADRVRDLVEFMDSRSEAIGAQIIAKAWTDADYKKRLLEDGTKAVEEFDIPMLGAELIVVENTPDVHNMIVCTLCSCYPRTILGLPPDWYKSKSYRSRAVIEPRAVLKEFGTDVAADTAVRVHDSNADMRYLVMPMQPEGTEDWSADQLADLITRDCMIGVTRPSVPETVAAE
ncbi:MAG: nitrile hydratase subunit alpha [Proteobacteria bacterium]|nr:nitrile hydratase subunit alpha [Pseudomonadota bacterium]